MNHSRLDTTRPGAPPVDPTVVSAEDVARIDVLQELLMTLNDPAASARAIGRHVEQSPVLRARIAARFRQRWGERDLPRRPADQIAALGNRELEGVLFQLLEDIVMLHTEMTSPVEP